MVTDLKAKVIGVEAVTMYRPDMEADWEREGEPQNYKLSDHDAIIMELKSGCNLRIKKYASKESYKLAPFLSSANKQLQYTRATNKLGGHR